MQALCSDEASFIQAKVKTFVTRSKKAVTVHCASPLFSWSFLFCPWFFFYFSHLSNALSPTLELWWLSEPFFKQNKSRYFKSSSNKAVVDHCSSFLFSWSFLLCPWFFLHFFSLHLSNTFELSRWQELRAYTIDQTKKTNKQTTAITFVARSLKSIVVQCASFFVLGSSCIWARLCMKTARTFSLNRRSNTIKFKLKPLVLLLLLASKQHFVANFGAVKTARTTSHYQWVLPVPDPELSLPVKRRWPLWQRQKIKLKPDLLWPDQKKSLSASVQALCSVEASFFALGSSSTSRIRATLCRQLWSCEDSQNYFSLLWPDQKKVFVGQCASSLFSWSFLLCPWFFFYFLHPSNTLSPTLELWRRPELLLTTSGYYQYQILNWAYQ